MNLFKKKKKRPQINSSTDDEIPINSDYHQMYATTTNHSRSPSVAYREGTKEAIERVLETIEEQAEKRIKDGFSELNFTLGVLNCFFIEFVFTVYPQHLWVVYLIEGLYLFPYKSGINCSLVCMGLP